VSERYPGYDVLAKRHSPSWNEQTREVIDRRLAIGADTHRFFCDDEWLTVCAVCDRVIPQSPYKRDRVPVAALLDDQLCRAPTEGYRDARLPPMGDAWKLAVRALDAESQQSGGCRFHELDAARQDRLLHRLQQGEAHHAAWHGLSPQLLFTKRLLHDIARVYYAHPTAWNEIGFGGPAAPRGYVRMNFDRRDPWEASEARPGRAEQARKENARIG
jgi:hypothetical protein